MSTLKADTLKPVTSDASLTLQGDSGGSGVTGPKIDSSGNMDFSGNTDAKIKLPSAGGIYESDGSTAILTESGGSATLANTALAGTVTGYEGTAVLSTGESGTDKYLRINGDDSSSWHAVPGGVSVAVIADQKPNNTDGGGFTQGAWQPRDLNTEISDPDSIVSISSDQFTLGAGDYLIEWNAPAYTVSYHKSCLYDITGTAILEYGNQTYQVNGSWSQGAFIHSPSGSNVYEIRHWCSVTKTINGYGVAFGADVSVETYTIVKIIKY